MKQKGEDVPFALFPYCPGPLSEGPARVEWKIITLEPIVSQHILCYKLKDGDTIPNVLAKCNEFTAALIIVNTDNAYVISRTFQWEGIDQPSYPVCVVTEEDGNRLLKMVEQQEMGDVTPDCQSPAYF